MSQGKLGDFIDDDSLEESETLRKAKIAIREMPENGEPNADDSCPWCLGSSDDFKVKYIRDVGSPDGLKRQVSCGHCDAVIPTDVEWYQNGVKMCFR